MRRGDDEGSVARGGSAVSGEAIGVCTCQHQRFRTEALGFCELGGAQDWIDGGRRIALDGDLPVNPHGGQLSEGRTHGFGFLYEAVTQLRGDAGERQVADARTAVVTSGGGTPSGVLLLQRADA